MAKTYAIGDLHGRYDLLLAAFDAIEAHAGADGVTIVTLGDYVDRGPQSRQVIETLMAGPRRASDRLICLKGNHEDMMVECREGRAERDWWLGNGGNATVRSYFGWDMIPQAHLDWCRALPMLFLDGYRAFVHADLDETKAPNEQTEARMLWSRRGRNVDCQFRTGYVVHGHTPFPDGPIVLPGRVNLDTLAWATGHLVIAVFDGDKPGGPTEFIEIQLAADPAFAEEPA